MTEPELRQILDDHTLWLNHNGGKRADIEGEVIPLMDLKHSNLAKSNCVNNDFSGLDLRGTNFYHAHLSTCDFTNADLRYVDFGFANLENCNFTGANTEGANFIEAIFDHTKAPQLVFIGPHKTSSRTISE